jgi:hypothetical protein
VSGSNRGHRLTHGSAGQRNANHLVPSARQQCVRQHSIAGRRLNDQYMADQNYFTSDEYERSFNNRIYGRIIVGDVSIRATRRAYRPN